MSTTLAQPRAVWRRSGLLLAPGLLVIFLWLATGWLVPARLAGRSAQLQGLVTTFLGIFIEALPFLLAGVVASVLIQQFVTPARLARLLPGNTVAATLAGSLLGMVFPVCECGAIPASRRLLSKGAPPSTGIAFALAAPVVNPIVIISTTVAFADWRWAAARVGLTVVIALAIGLILGAGFRRERVLAPAALRPEHEHGPACDHDHAERGWRGMLAHGSAEFFEMGQYLVIGALLAATMQSFVPQSWFIGLTQEAGLGMFGPLVAIVVLMLIALVLSVCSTVDAFLALSFLGLFHPGAIMAFLVFGPMIDIKSTLMLATTFRRQTVAAMVALAFGFCVVAGLVTAIVLA